MRSYDRDAILGRDLVFDLQLDEGVGGFTRDLGPGRKTADFNLDVGAVYPVWAVETIGALDVMTVDFAWVLDTAEPFLDFGVATAPFDLISTNDAFSIEVVFYADAASAQHCLLAGHVEEVAPSGAAFPQLSLDSDGYFDFRPCRDSAGAGGYVVGSVDLTAGWHHMIATYSDSDDLATVTVDGGVTDSDEATMDTTTAVYDVVGAAEDVYVGARYNANGGVLDHQSFYDGHIAFIRMWGRRLAVVERAELFARIQGKYGL